MIFPSVDFPAPFAPTSACTDPPAMSTLTSSSALVPEYLLPIETSRTEVTAASLIRLVLDSGSSSIFGWLTPRAYPSAPVSVQSGVKFGCELRYAWSMIAGRVLGLRILTTFGTGLPLSASYRYWMPSTDSEAGYRPRVA